MNSNPSPPPKVVVDTNVWVSAVFWGEKPRRVIEAWINNRFLLVISPALRAELYRKIGEKAEVLGTVPDYALKWMEIVNQKSVLVRPKEGIEVCRDPKDNMLLEASTEGSADYLVTGDNDLLVLGAFRNTKIVTPAEFLLSMS